MDDEDWWGLLSTLLDDCDGSIRDLRRVVDQFARAYNKKEVTDADQAEGT